MFFAINDKPVNLFDATVAARKRAAPNMVPIEAIKARDYVFVDGRATYVVQVYPQPDDSSVALELDGGEFVTRDYGNTIEVWERTLSPLSYLNLGDLDAALAECAKKLEFAK